MTLNIREANKRLSFLSLAIEGQDFSGKTYSSLLMATAIVEKIKQKVEKKDIVIISTEKDKVDIYDGIFNYSVIDIPKPYKPEDLINAISICVDNDVMFVIVDSLTHFWTNIKDRVDSMVNKYGDKLGMAGWNRKGEGKPLLNGMLSAIKDSPIHIIATVRAKAKVGIAKVDGKNVVFEKGILPEMQKSYGFDFLVKMKCIDQESHLFSVETRDGGLCTFHGSFIPDKKLALELFKYAGGNDYGSMKEKKLEELSKKRKILSIYLSYVKKELKMSDRVNELLCVDDYNKAMDLESLVLATKFVKETMLDPNNLTNEGAAFIEKRKMKMEAK